MARSEASARTRLSAWLVVGFVALFLVGFSSSFVPSARAQDAEKKDEKKDDKPTTTKEEKPAEGNIFIHIVKSAGWVFGPILLLISICLIALIVLLFMDLRFGSAIPPGFVEDFTDTVNKRQFKAAYEMARDDGSFLGRVMSAGMARLQYGIDDAREAAMNQVDAMKASKDQFLTFLAIIGTLGPLIGLLGTVWGMIRVFQELGSADRVVPARLAGGISHALVVTLLGIGLSVPAIFFHGFFKNRLTRLSQEAGNMADDLLTQMYHNSKKAGAGPAPETNAVPVPAAATAAAAAPTAGVRRG
jgi:biopolymer transport protein ExbB